MGDLMEDEYQIEAKLVKWFSLAERWKAILLLDEADIFLERRATRDIQRNGIVSIFLRRMEYFRGLLFLTTNRVGQIDDAFLSRVTAVLQYDHLTDDVRKKIWEGFFRKLEKDGERKILNKDAEGKSLKKGSDEFHDQRKIEIDKYARKYVLNDEEVKKLKWNGREIRNVCFTSFYTTTLSLYNQMTLYPSPTHREARAATNGSLQVRDLPWLAFTEDYFPIPTLTSITTVLFC